MRHKFTNKRFKFLFFLLIVLYLLLNIKLFEIQIIKHKYYLNKLETITKIEIDGPSSARGKIYDRNGYVIVDNKTVYSLYYKRKPGVSNKDELSLARRCAEIIDVDYRKIYNYDLRNYWILVNPEKANKKITEEEWKKFEVRELTIDDIYDYKRKRITTEELNSMDEIDKKAAYIYYLMNNDYSYIEKLISFDINEYEKNNMEKKEMDGFVIKEDWDRYYPYKDVMRNVLGNVSSQTAGIPLEYKNVYLKLGYSLKDRVGISYLEKQYESILKGKKNTYTLDENGEYLLHTNGSVGNDIVLTIDINLQKEVEKIIEEELIYTKKNDKYTSNFDRAFVVISNPSTGEILAFAGKKVVKEEGKYKVYDYSNGIISESITPGSSIKAASHMVGYLSGQLRIGEVRNDACIKLAATPLKCSYHSYGNIDDLQALAYSSNTYQFHTAIKVGGGKYRYNNYLKIDKDAFNTYRNIFSEFGLGVKTGIDLPNEQLGYKGTKDDSGLLLDLAIGQYDNYTPIQMSQYINTVASNGIKMKPYLLKEVYSNKNDNSNLIYINSSVIQHKLKFKQKYMDRIKEGLRLVFKYGTGYKFIDNKFKPAGKTGTSQSFVDTNNDGKIDTETLSTSLVAYAPYDDPVVTFTIITPNVGTGKLNFNQMSQVNKRLSQKISKKYFEIYK